MGVWIETSLQYIPLLHHQVTPCVGVWIETYNARIVENTPWSHPAWVCGLKPEPASLIALLPESHPAWVCGLKLYNRFHECSAFWVTPCVGVWIETIIVIYF